MNSSFQGSNNTDELRARGLRTPNSLKLQYDINPGLGGPIRADKLWFYTSARFTRQANYIGGLFQNKNAFDITKWAYEPDESKPAFSDSTEESVNLRLTWQASQANKFSFFYDTHWRCQCAFTATTVAQEAAHLLEYPIQDLSSVSYTAAFSSRILVEARAGVRREEFAYTPNNPEDPNRLLIPVIEQGGLIPGLLYRGRGLANATQPYQRTLGVRHSLVGVDVLRHRQPLGQVRRLQRHRHPRVNGARQLRQADLPVQQRRAQPVDAAGDAARSDRAAEVRPGHLRAGQVDAQPPDAQWRRSFRHVPELLPRADARTGSPRAEPEHHVPEDRHGQLEGRRAADGRVLRRVRQRQDGLQGVAQQVRDAPRGCRARTAIRPTR